MTLHLSSHRTDIVHNGTRTRYHISRIATPHCATLAVVGVVWESDMAMISEGLEVVKQSAALYSSGKGRNTAKFTEILSAHAPYCGLTSPILVIGQNNIIFLRAKLQLHLSCSSKSCKFIVSDSDFIAQEFGDVLFSTRIPLVIACIAVHSASRTSNLLFAFIFTVRASLFSSIAALDIDEFGFGAVSAFVHVYRPDVFAHTVG